MGKTYAEMTSEEKNSVSHRGLAIEKLLKNKEFFEI
jgi:inosine/xanthosine triphosphate pyrophosphatase family protein